MDTLTGKQHAHELIDLLPPAQITALVGLPESFCDPVAAALRNAPPDDEPESDGEKQAAHQARQWLERNGGRGTPHDEAMRRLGL